MVRCFGFLVLLMTLPTQVWAEPFVYVSVSGEKRIAVFRLDADTGGLEAAGSLDVDGSPGAIWEHPSRPEFFVALRSKGKLATLDVNTSTGMLSVGHETTPGESSPFVLPDPSGRYLLSAYYGAGKVMVHAIADDGSLSAEPLQVIETAINAHCIRLDPSGRYAFVPHTGPNAVFQFRWDGRSGRLMANDPPRVPNTLGSENELPGSRDSEMISDLVKEPSGTAFSGPPASSGGDGDTEILSLGAGDRLIAGTVLAPSGDAAAGAEVVLVALDRQAGEDRTRLHDDSRTKGVVFQQSEKHRPRSNRRVVSGNG